MSKTVCTGFGSMEEMKVHFAHQLKYVDHAVGIVRDVFVGDEMVVLHGTKGELIFRWTCGKKAISGGVMKSFITV